MTENSTPAQRVRAFIDARSTARGFDPEIITSYNDLGLTYADLKALLAAAEASPYRADRITDQNVQDIVDTAAYGGITYWASEPPSSAFEAAPSDEHYTFWDGEEGKAHYVDKARIRQAVVEVAEGKHTNDEIANYVRSAFNQADEDGIDCGQIDASAADCIVQVACFGKVVYG